MSIPLFVLLPVYGLCLLFWLIFSFFAVFHLVKFGVASLLAFSATFLYLAISIIILFLSYQYISATDWKQSVEILSLTKPPF